MKINVFIHRQSGIKIAPQTLRHKGNAVRQRLARLLIGHIAAKHVYLPALNDFHARNQRKQRRFAHAIRPDQAHGGARRQRKRNIAQGFGFAVAVGNGIDNHSRSWFVHIHRFIFRRP